MSEPNKELIFQTMALTPLKFSGEKAAALLADMSEQKQIAFISAIQEYAKEVNAHIQALKDQIQGKIANVTSEIEQ